MLQLKSSIGTNCRPNSRQFCKDVGQKLFSAERLGFFGFGGHFRKIRTIAVTVTLHLVSLMIALFPFPIP